jgi:hypothetical protein
VVRPGQYARVRVAIDEKKGAILVPQRSVMELQGVYSVAVVKPDDTIDLRMVKPAERIGTEWVIDSGLKAGERIVVEGVQKVRAGSKVTPLPWPRWMRHPQRPWPPRRRRSRRPWQASSSDGPSSAIVISIIIVLLGLNSLRGLSFEQYPFLAPPTIRVTATYPGASAVAVEQSVATPIEQEVNGVEGMVYMKSSNTSDGRMQLDVNFEVGTNQDMANVPHPEPRQRGPGPAAPGSGAAGGHGQEAEPQHPDADLALLPERELRRELPHQLLRHQPPDQLLRIPGIAQVDLFGGTDYGMRIWLRPDRMAKLGLTPSDVINAIKEQNLQAPPAASACGLRPRTRSSRTR